MPSEKWTPRFGERIISDEYGPGVYIGPTFETALGLHGRCIFPCEGSDLKCFIDSTFRFDEIEPAGDL